MEYNVTNIEDIVYPGKTMNFFKITVGTDCFKAYDFIKTCIQGREVLIITNPKQKWYQLLWQFITFGYYKAGWYYKVKL